MTASPGSEDVGLVLSAEERHWVSDAPTSLHGNGAGSFALATRDPRRVTCKLCRYLLSRTPPGDCSCGASGMPTTHLCGAKCEHA